eukprot:1161007-Pelagomonas_calceolata.AAC.5
MKVERKPASRKGAYGTVVKAKDRTTGLDVAIKIIPLTDTDPDELKTIQKEINFLSQCSHPNVVKYIVSAHATQATSKLTGIVCCVTAASPRSTQLLGKHHAGRRRSSWICHWISPQAHPPSPCPCSASFASSTSTPCPSHARLHLKHVLLSLPLAIQGSYRHQHELWIVMEYCGGGSVNDLLAASHAHMPEQAIAYVCGEALKVSS